MQLLNGMISEIYILFKLQKLLILGRIICISINYIVHIMHRTHTHNANDLLPLIYALNCAKSQVDRLKCPIAVA